MIIDNPMMTGYAVPIMAAPGAVARCERCKAPMYPGETLYRWQGQQVCDECLEEAVHRMNAADIASAFDIETEEVE
jgi:hypothetical protein